jgi:molecular chaperone GrpE
MTDTDVRAAEPEPERPAHDEQTPEPNRDPVADDQIEALTREVAELKDRLLRALAEAENTRRRGERDVADARSYGISMFARDLLAVADNMRRALDAIDPQIRENADSGVTALVSGVELTERELLNVLEKHGVKKIEPGGAKFDPHRHQAMFEVPDDSVPAGTVVQVMQPGYIIGDRVLRPALVSVSKGGPRTPAPDAAPAPSANDNAPPQ